MAAKPQLILVICTVAAACVNAASIPTEEEILKRTLFKQEPQTQIPSFLSENGRALPRKIQSNSGTDWLLKYKTLLQQWSQERQMEKIKQETQFQQTEPTVLSTFVSPETKAVSYLISGPRASTTTITTRRPTDTTTRYVPDTTPRSSTTSSLLFTTLENALSTTPESGRFIN